MNTTPATNNSIRHTSASVLFRASAIPGHPAQFRARVLVLMHLAGHPTYRRHLALILRALAAMERRAL